ncbi:MAG: hypothetical protein LLF92_08850 [Planctomycetaceae bacterium]|nr:hypothetical protein [Planctomycetaceae bacterium]
MAEIFRLCDRITVLRDGKTVASCDIGQTTENKLIEMMIGRSFEACLEVHLPDKQYLQSPQLKVVFIVDTVEKDAYK